MNRCRPIVAQLTRCSQGYSRHESPTSHVCTREESEQLAPSSITTTSATTGFFSASSTSSLFGCPRTWLQTLRTGTVAAGSRVCVGTEIYLRLNANEIATVRRPSVFSQGPPERTCLEHGNGIVFALSGARDSLRAPAACPRAYTLHALSFASVMPSCGIVGHRGHLFSSLIHSTRCTRSLF